MAMALLGGMCLTPPIKAQPQTPPVTGQWVATYRWSQGTGKGLFGSRVYASYGHQVSETFAWNYATSVYDDSPYDYRDDEPNLDQRNSFFQGLFDRQNFGVRANGNGVAASSELNGTIKVTWKWVPRQGYTNAGPVPDRLIFGLSATAIAIADSHVDSDTSVVDGRGRGGEEVQASVSLGNSGGQNKTTAEHGGLYVARGGKVYNIATNGRTEINDAEFSVTVKAKVPSGRSKALPPVQTMGGPRTPYADDKGTTSAFVQVQLKAFDKTVKLSRLGARYEDAKLENGEWHTYGDSIYSAAEANGFDAQDVKPEINIETAHIGEWGQRPDGTLPFVTPSWSASGFSSSFEQSAARYAGYAKYGTPTVSGGTYSADKTGAQEFVTSYTGTDTRDNLEAKAYYHLTLHDPVEPISAGEGEAVSLSTYQVKSPAKDASGPLVYSGFRDANTAETTIRVGRSYEAGLDLTATFSIDAVKDLLGFTGEARLSATTSVSVDTELKVPAIAAQKFIYAVAVQPFQRRHARFYVYDQGGRFKRMVTKDASGQTYPAFEVYHEAIRDTAFETNFTWSDEMDVSRTDINNLPRTIEPEPLGFDYSGGVS